MAVDERRVAALVAEVLARLENTPSHRALVLACRDKADHARVRTTVGEAIELLYLDEGIDPATVDRLLLPTLHWTDMADLANGRAVGKVSRLMLDLLLAGREIEVLEYAYHDRIKQAPPALIALYRRYEEQLKSFGLRPLARRDAPLAPERKLLSEKDLIACRAAGQMWVRISRNGVVTALAADYAKAHGMTIFRGEEAS